MLTLVEGCSPRLYDNAIALAVRFTPNRDSLEDAAVFCSSRSSTQNGCMPPCSSQSSWPLMPPCKPLLICKRFHVNAVDEYLLSPRPEHVHGRIFSACRQAVSQDDSSRLRRGFSFSWSWQDVWNEYFPSLCSQTVFRSVHSCCSRAFNRKVCCPIFLLYIPAELSHAHVQVLEAGGTRPLHAR